MEDQTILLYSSLSTLIFVFIAFKFLFLIRKRCVTKHLPPTPPSRPITGHLHILKPPTHQALHNLSQRYGPIISLRLGSRRVILVSSPKIAEECFTKNDIVLANRPESLMGKYLSYNHSTISMSSYGDHWRNLRRITSVEILSSSRLNQFSEIRIDEIKRLLLKLSSMSSQEKFIRVELRPMLVDVTFNNVTRMVAGKRYYGENVTDYKEANQFKSLIAEILESYGVGGYSSKLFPLLNWLGNHEKKLQNLGKRLDKFLQGLVDEHRVDRGRNTMIGHLLSLQETEPEYYSDHTIKGMVMTLIIAGTDTAAVTLEWAMSNLLNHPEVLDKARKEIDAQVGKERAIEESEVGKLHYLQSVVWETLRMYPATPLLLPHMSSADCTLGGYDVPSGTMVLINAYAIHRDPDLWDDSLTFKPERFEKEEMRDSYKLLPFGMGRRACPGAGLAHRILGLALGSLIQCFEWKRVSEQKVDMSEGNGATMPKIQPLEAMCKARPVVSKVF